MQKNITNYISDSFNILFSNKILFLTGAINTAFIGVFALISYSLTSGFFDSNMFITISFVLLTSIISAYISGGQLHLIKLIYQKEYALKNNIEVINPRFADFIEGSKRFGLNLWGGSLVVAMGAAFIFVPIFFIIQMIAFDGLEKLLFLLVFVAILFICLWPTILVIEDIQVESAIPKSIAFSKNNFSDILFINIITGIINFQNKLKLDLGFLSKNFKYNSDIQIPVIYQYIFSIIGPISLPVIFVFLTLFNLISSMVIIDLYLDRKDLQWRKK